MNELPDPLFILGFDLRQPFVESSDWPVSRRSRFLLRQDVARPLSVDPIVWPRVDGRRDDENPLGLFSNLRNAAKARLAVFPSRAGTPVLIEIAVSVFGLQNAEYWANIFSLHSIPENDGESAHVFETLGYDVGDHSLISGLSNCLLSPQERSDLRRDWLSALNQFGLFNRAGDAQQFARVCDELISEHAPFSVFRIRRIDISGTFS